MSSCMKLHKQPQPFPKAGVKRSPSITQAGTDRRPSQEQREVKASPQVDTPATKLKSKPSSSKPSSLPVVKQEQRKAHHPSIAFLIPCSSFITMESSSSYISFCTPSLVALLYLPIKVNKGPSVSDGLDAPHWCQGPLWQCVRNACTTPHISFPPQPPKLNFLKSPFRATGYLPLVTHLPPSRQGFSTEEQTWRCRSGSAASLSLKK